MVPRPEAYLGYLVPAVRLPYALTTESVTSEQIARSCHSKVLGWAILLTPTPWRA